MDSLFEVHRLNELGMKKAEQIAETFNNCAQELSGLCPAGREWSIVRTKLEEAAFFAKKAMATQPQNQEVPVPA